MKETNTRINMGLEFIGVFFAAMVWYEMIILAIVSLAIVGLMWNENGAIPFIGFMGILFYGWGTNEAFITVSSALDAWLYVAGYIIAGLAWSFFKWGRLVNYYIGYHEHEEDVRYSLKTYSTDKIAYWIIWWPFSILGFVFDDAIAWIIDHFKGVYNMITEKMIGNAISNSKYFFASS